MMLWGVLAVCFAAGWAAEVLDPGLSGVKKITPSGWHSGPKFSADGRFVYVTGRGSQYGSQCEHVYRYDRADPPLAPSLVSTGIGREMGSARRQLDDKAYQQIAFTTTAAEQLRKLRADPEKAFSEQLSCPASKCTGTIDDAVKAACNLPRRVEYYDGATTAFAWLSGITKYFSGDTNAYEVLGDFAGPFSIHSEKRGAAAKQQNIQITDEDEEKQSISSNTLWSSGFSISSATGRAYYAGALSTSITKSSVPKGVVPFSGSRIYALPSLAAGAKEQIVVQSAEYSYLEPAISPTDPTVLVATRMDAKGKRTLVKIKLTADGMKADGEEEILTADKPNSWAPAFSPDGKFITFVSDRDTGDQVYVASVGTVEQTPTIKRVMAEPFSPLRSFVHMKDPILYGLEAGIPMGPITKARISDKSVLFRSEVDGCGHIFQLDLGLRDKSVYRKLSTGVHSYGGASNTLRDVVFDADLHRELSALGCKADTCAQPEDAKQKKLCDESIRPRHLPKRSELYLGNLYGTITERITKNNVWEGESRTSNDGRLVAYTRRSGHTFQLWLLNLDTRKWSQLEPESEVGFIFDIAFSADNTKLTYAAYRPKSTSEQFREKLDSDIVDIRHSQIYVYDIASKKEKPVGVGKGIKGDYWHSPNFYSGTDQILFLSPIEDPVTENKRKLTHMWRCRLIGTEDCVDLGELWFSEDVDFSVQGSTLVVGSEAGVFHGTFSEVSAPVTSPPDDETTSKPDSAAAISSSLFALMGIFALRWI